MADNQAMVRSLGTGERAHGEPEIPLTHADLVRFKVKRLESGLYRHVAVKYVFEVSRQSAEWFRR